MKQITEDELNQLEDDSWFLSCLLSAGVRDWEGYQRAFDLYKEGNYTPPNK